MSSQFPARYTGPQKRPLSSHELSAYGANVSATKSLLYVVNLLGELTHGFYVHGLSIETAMLAEGWQSRRVPVRNANTRGFSGFCLTGGDLAASKLAAFRIKDEDFVRLLLSHGLVPPVPLMALVLALQMTNEAERHRRLVWVRATVDELELARRAPVGQRPHDTNV